MNLAMIIDDTNAACERLAMKPGRGDLGNFGKIALSDERAHVASQAGRKKAGGGVVPLLGNVMLADQPPTSGHGASDAGKDKDRP